MDDISRSDIHWYALHGFAWKNLGTLDHNLDKNQFGHIILSKLHKLTIG
jgi:hypothetical protein